MLRVLLDWLVVGRIIDVNPLAPCAAKACWSRKAERRCCLYIPAAIDTGSLTGLRRRALIGMTIYTFARFGAVLQVIVGDYFELTQQMANQASTHDQVL